jgi:Uncharacterized protein conserved in bacteria (DUF2325)
MGGPALGDDYELHGSAVAECKRRSPVADVVQKELERRYASTVREAAIAKSPEMLATWWCETARSTHVAGALWATLTHPRCTREIEHLVLSDVHMLQHQVGMATRVEAARFEALIDENAVLARALGAAQQRTTKQSADHAQQVEQLQATISRQSLELVIRDSALSQLREKSQALEAAMPDLRSRFDLAEENERQLARIHEPQRTVLRCEQEVERQGRRADSATAELARGLENTRDHDRTTPASGLIDLRARAVLCVGCFSSSVPAYRQLIERTGGRFMHHDGGEEDSSAKLDLTLAAADLVICQTGCISHNAYWRVKDHCKRTGKRCVFVESPSRAMLERALTSGETAPIAQELGCEAPRAVNAGSETAIGAERRRAGD